MKYQNIGQKPIKNVFLTKPASQWKRAQVMVPAYTIYLFNFNIGSVYSLFTVQLIPTQREVIF